MTEQNIINSTEFARKGLELRGTILVSQFSRCADALAIPARGADSLDGFADQFFDQGKSQGEIAWRLSGQVNSENMPQLNLVVTGMLNLACQRCLGPYAFQLDVDSDFIIVPSEADLPSEEDDIDDERDYLVAETHMNVAELIEDEVLLALPFAPKHEASHCSVADSTGTNSAGANSTVEIKKPNPFAVLQGFKTGKPQT